jgi:hypothetical protein
MALVKKTAKEIANQKTKRASGIQPLTYKYIKINLTDI